MAAREIPVQVASTFYREIEPKKRTAFARRTGKRAGAIAGTTGLYPHWDKRLANLGISLDEQFWGRGYAGERADATLTVAFDRLDLEIVVAAHIDGNEHSRRAIKKYVERYNCQYEARLRNWLLLADTVADVYRYTISREECFEATEW